MGIRELKRTLGPNRGRDRNAEAMLDGGTIVGEMTFEARMEAAKRDVLALAQPIRARVREIDQRAGIQMTKRQQEAEIGVGTALSEAADELYGDGQTKLRNAAKWRDDEVRSDVLATVKGQNAVNALLDAFGGRGGEYLTQTETFWPTNRESVKIFHIRDGVDIRAEIRVVTPAYVESRRIKPARS